MMDTRARVVRFWTALIIYSGAGWASVEILLAVRVHYGLPALVDVVIVSLFVAGFLATVLLLKTRVASGPSPILQAMRAFAVVLMLAAIALFIAHWLQPDSGGPGLGSLATGLGFVG